MLKILLSSSAFFPHSFGGGEVYVYRLAKELLRRGHDVNVLTRVHHRGTKGPYAIDRYNYENIPVISFALDPDGISAAEAQTEFGPLVSEALRAAMSEVRSDIVHINGMKPALISLCGEMGIPHVVTAHHAGIVCPSGGLVKSNGSICDGPMDPKYCVPCDSFSRRPRWYTGGAIGKIPSWIYRPLGERLNKLASLSYIERGLIYPWLIEQKIAVKKEVMEKLPFIIAPSKSIRDLLVRNGCDPHKIAVLHHGIEPLKAPPIEGLHNRPVRFGYMGRIDPSKGLHMLMKAAELLQDGKSLELHIFGAARNADDEYYKKKIFTGYRGNARIFDHGFVPQNRLSEAYARIDVLVVPSLLPEAFGLVVPEAFSAGRPVIVFNSGALPEMIRHQVDGFIIEKNDSKSLAEFMQKIIEQPNLVIEMSRRIPRILMVKEHVDDIEKIYSKVINEKMGQYQMQVV